MLTKIGNVYIDHDHCPKIMGIVNTSPESFYKRSIKLNTTEIQNTVLEMQRYGADIIDVGGMSTAPYLKTLIPVELEIERLKNAVTTIRQISDIPISIDSIRSGVLKALLKYDINAINDISGLRYDKQMSNVVSECNLPIIIGASRIFSESCLTTGDIYDTIDILSESIKIAEKSFIDHNKIIVDPSIGFFRKKESPFSSKINGLEWYIRDIDILSNINLMKSLNKPICISISRKSFIGSIFDLSEDERLIPSIIAEVHCMLNGVSLIRTHNVKETRLAMNMISIINALN